MKMKKCFLIPILVVVLLSTFLVTILPVLGATPATASTQAASLITSSTARLNGIITDDGGEPCLARFRYRSVFSGDITSIDDFEWGNDGDDIDTSGGDIIWTKIVAGTSTAKISTDQKVSGTRSLKLYRDGTNSAQATFSYAAADGQTYRFRIRKSDLTSFTFRRGNGTHVIYFEVGSSEIIYYWDGSYHDTGYSVEVDTWCLFELTNVNFTTGTYDIYFNGSLIKSGATMATSAAQSGILSFANLGGTGDIYIDDIGGWTLTEWQNTLVTDSTYYEDIADLTLGTEYVFQTQAKNSAGEGVWSASAYFETLLIIVPVAISQPASGIDVDSARLNGKIEDDGGALCEARFRWGGKCQNLDNIDGIGGYNETNPVIPCGAVSEWDEYIREIGNVLYEPGDVGKEYKIFYSGYIPPYVQDEVYVGYAYSSDGKIWTKAGKVITRSLEDPWVINVGDIYYLYAEDKEGGGTEIRKYHSADCEIWTDDGVVLSPVGATWESQDVDSPIVWKEGDTWYMLYEGRASGQEGAVGLATSTDGADWTREETNPVFEGTNITWATHLSPDCITKIGSTYYLAYHGYDGAAWRVGLATSTDLLEWVDKGSFLAMVNSFENSDSTFLFDTEYVIFGSTTASGIYRSYPIYLNITDWQNTLETDGTYYEDIVGLDSGTDYIFQTQAQNSAGEGDWSASAYFLTMPAAPTNVSATDGDHTDKVVVTWTKSDGATGYKVYEGDNLLDTLDDVAAYDDTFAPAPTITAGSTIASDGSSTAHVSLELSGTSTNNGAPRTYKVKAFNDSGDSPDSDTDTGYRGVGELAYQWQVSTGDSDENYENIVGGTTENYDYSDAPAPSVTAGNATASDGTSGAHVTLTVNNHAANNGDGRWFQCVLTAEGAVSQDSTADRGYRGTDTLGFQWWKSATDLDADYSVIEGATTNPYNDTEGVVEPDGRYYLCAVNMTGAVSQNSTADRGYKLVIVAPNVTAHDTTGITSTSGILHGEIINTGNENPDTVGFEWGYSAGNYSHNWTDMGDFGLEAFSHTISGLSMITTVFWRAFAINSGGTGYSVAMNFTTLALPLAPTNFTIIQVGYNSYNISWTMGIAASTTIVRASETGYPDGVTDGYPIYSGNSTWVIVTGLDPNMTTYYFRAWSENDYGYSLDYAEAILENPLGIAQLLFALGLFGFALWKKGWIRTILSLCVIMWGTFAMPYDVKIAAPLIAVGTILFVSSILDIRKGGDK